MPAVSKVQRKAMAIAEHHPEELYARNRGLMGMSLEDLRHYSRTKEGGLPKRKVKVKVKVKKRKRRS